MPAPIETGLRLEIIRRHEGGESLRDISEGLRLSYETVKKLWQRWRRAGKVEPSYERAKRRGTRVYAGVYETALGLKQAHPRWGAARILVALRQGGTLEALPSVRSMQRWFQAAGLSRRQAPDVTATSVAVRVGRGQAVHEVWAVDAKEAMALADGSHASWLVVSDEASGAVLHTEVFPPPALDPGERDSGSGQLTTRL